MTEEAVTEPICLAAEVRPIPGYFGYAVSAAGAIYGPKGRLRPMVADSGHLYVLARRPGVPCKLFVHKAVLAAWVGPCPPGHEARHIDGQPANNVVGNLRWGTRTENAADRARHGVQLRGSRVPGAKLTEAQVVEIRERRPLSTLRALGQRYGVDPAAIHRAAAGQTWAHVKGGG